MTRKQATEQAIFLHQHYDLPWAVVKRGRSYFAECYSEAIPLSELLLVITNNGIK